MILELIILLFTTITCYFLCEYRKNHNYFEKNGVKYLPGWPAFGNTFNSTFKRKHMIEDIDAVYKAFPNERYVGYTEAISSLILIRDPEIIKDITVKNFEHFVNHRDFMPEGFESIFSSSIFNLKDDRWRDMRVTLSPAFTSSKMKLMMPLMVDISMNIVEYLKDHQTEDIFVDDIIRRYTTDVIASAAFGLQVNSLVDKDNEFYKSGDQIFSFDFSQIFNWIFIWHFPKLAKILGLSLFPKKITSFFHEIVASTIKYRLENKVERPDMIQLLIEANKGTLKQDNASVEKEIGYATVEEHLKPKITTQKWTEGDIASQVFMFFIAGFETSASGITLCLHELALNPEVEEKLYNEIKLFNDTKGKLLYDNMGELKYLDCVLNETQRKWSAAIVLDRVCTKTYELPPPREGGKPFKVTPGQIVYNCVNSIHMDPQYYPDPEKFDPDRFSDENKKFIKPFTFMPFGAGPRNCIGSRFALMELKVLLYYLVLNFKIVKCERTTNPIKLLPKDFKIKALGGSWVRFQSRE